MNDKDKAEEVVKGLIALQPPGPEVTDPVEWAKRTTLLAEQLYQLAKLQFEMLKTMVPIVVEQGSPYGALLASHALCLMALKMSGKSMLKANNTVPLNLLDEQKAKAREMLSEESDMPEELRNALLRLLGTEEASDDDEFFPKDGITLPFDGGKVH